MAVTTFIPELWAARLLANLEKAHVATAFVNRDYEGEIRQMGDTVHINSLGALTIGTYQANTDMNAAETLVTTDQTLVIDQAKYFHFQVDDIDRVQAAGDLVDTATRQAAYQLADLVDTAIFAAIGNAATTANTLGTAAAPINLSGGSVTAYDQLLKLRTIMAKANVPSETWRVACPPEFIALLLGDSRFVAAGVGGAEERLVNGFVGRAAGFDIFESNNLPTTSSGSGTSAVKGNVVLAAPAFATTFAEQILEVEGYRPELRFADAVKGLDVYGIKNLYPEAVGKLIFN